MCLGIPGRITRVWGDHGLINGDVDFGGVVKQVCLSYVPEASVGDYVIVHVGFAITQVDEEEARRTLAVLAEMGDVVSTELAGGVTSLDELGALATGGPARGATPPTTGPAPVGGGPYEGV